MIRRRNPNSKCRRYDDFLKEGDADKDGVLSKEESLKTSMKDFFDSSDANKDGKYTREESEMLKKFMEASRNSAFALKPGGSGDVTESHMLWKQTSGLPYVASAIVYRGQFVMVKDGGIVTAYDAEIGRAAVPETRRGERQLLRVAGGGEWAHLFHVAAGGRGDGD